ncbi:helix-turn-helix domain-containing protein [Echinicola sp. CAU 1574]|uniref:Helix-turn-helix domain-containing protein n=1 Tax=Echinicola arenosa TaxID=2774144 RepID=A0ABR9ANK4_9BACT|nr:helix-turn-helix domain-containing protein [Echinicola arenosa]MBD8489199.1 helix-turn-helix domain-containing protein [Echinicola arenosa]
MNYLKDMSDTPSNTENFVDQAESIILENVSNEEFGVSDLAEAMHTSRSNLLRKIKQQTKLSASQFIRQVRLEKSMEILGQTSLTVSEVSFNVGFGSTSYFIKCFREYYGYPPGEVGRRGKLDKSSAATSARHRQLVAIMFTDIEGYTALMQTDEKKGVAYRDRHRKVFDATTKKYNGRILQYYGDGTLSTFSSAIDAVRCGIEMQLAFREEPTIPIRIGIHSGDIIVSDEEIIGDGVNVASRIESLAKTGSIYISDKVYDEVKNQDDLLAVSMGIHKLKNVTKPIEVYAVSNDQLGAIERSDASVSKRNPIVKWSLIVTTVLLIAILAYSFEIFNGKLGSNSAVISNDKSIAVLPFKNESSDSSNQYFVNGLMESTLNNLQKIKDLRVISRSSVEKYRNTDMTIPEIAEELQVSYFVEGSGQKIGDQILLHIQLIEASTDRHLWAEQYNREVVDVFELQNEVARKIVSSIEVIVTPSELDLIEKKPTENLLAYDYYLRALGPLHSRTHDGLQQAIGLLKKAIELDPEFALAYANIAISYYLLEISQLEKQYTEKINSYADKALLYDSKSAESLIAKSFYYLQTKEYSLALPHLEKALEYNPNSSFAIQMLADFYFRIIPNSGKYLEYALKGVQLDVAANDAVTLSYLYLNLSNAFIQNGFVDEAITYINKSLDLFPENHFAPYVKALIMYAKEPNIERTKQSLKQLWKRDTTRLDILQEVANFYFYEEDYDSAFYFFHKFVSAKEANGLDIYPQDDLRIGKVYEKKGFKEQSKHYYQAYTEYCENDQSIYKNASLAMKFANEGKIDLAIEHLNKFAMQDNFQYWILVFMKIDPLVTPLRDHPAFDEVMQKIEDRFWENQARLEKSLEEKELI